MIQTEDMEFAPRVISPEVTQDDGDIEVTLRPQNLHEYIGQDKVKEKIAIYIEAAKSAASPSTTYFCTDLPDWARPLFRR